MGLGRQSYVCGERGSYGLIDGVRSRVARSGGTHTRCAIYSRFLRFSLSLSFVLADYLSFIYRIETVPYGEILFSFSFFLSIFSPFCFALICLKAWLRVSGSEVDKHF